MKKLLFLILTFPFCCASRAQNTPGSNHSAQAHFVPFTDATRPAFSRNSLQVIDSAGRRTRLLLKPLEEEMDALGQTHYRSLQLWQGHPVEDAMIIQHVSAGKLISVNGNWIDTVTAIPSDNPAIDEKKALAIALRSVGAKAYSWQVKDKTGIEPQGELVWLQQAGNFRLAWKFDIYATQPLSRQWIYVDAQAGKLLEKRNRIHTADTPATAATVFSGNKTISTELYNGSYRLRETGRGNGIQTFNIHGTELYGSATDFTNPTTTWNTTNAQKDEYATDAHWATEKTYDFYKNVFGRSSIDNQGYRLISYVHYGQGYANAFWDGRQMHYGDGNATTNFIPLTALDICGHEISHGLTEYTSGLIYSGESGALNEGFSDIFGTCVEFYARPEKADWLIGGDVFVFRSLSDPKQYGQPNTYKGINWYTGTADDGGVHTNSGVLNYWFYLLAHGGTGTNDKGCTYSVPGIGIDKAEAIAWRTNVVYLGPNSQYADAAKYSIQAAKDLYGAGSNEAIQTANAWAAVGLGQVAARPSITASATTVCSGTSVTLSISTGSLNGASQWMWYSGSCGGALVGSGTSISVSPSTTTTYYVRGEGICGTTGTCASITITTRSSPVLVVTQPAPVCFPATVDLTTLIAPSSNLPSGTTVQYLSGNLPVTDPKLINASGTYTIRATLNTCVDEKQVTVLIKQLPVITLQPNSFCSNAQPIDLTNMATPVGGIWTGATVTTSNAAYMLDPSRIKSGTDNITYTNNGCTVSKMITIDPVPIGSASLTSQTITSGSAITPIQLGADLPGTAFTWTRDNSTTVTGIPVSGSGNISGTLSHNLQTPQDIHFAVTPVRGNCTGTTFQATVRVLPAPDNEIIKIGPNPTTNEFILQPFYTTETITITVSDISGRTLEKINSNVANPIHFGATYPAGVYIISIKKDNTITNQKLIKL